MSEKIALFSSSLAGGGSERVMLNLAYGLVEKGIAVDMVLSSARGEHLKKLDDRVRLIDLGAKRVASSLPALIGYLRKEKPHALLSTQAHANVIALLACTFPGIDTRVVVREVTSKNREDAKKTWFRTGIVSLLGRRLYRRAFRVIAVCHDLRQEIADAGRAPLDKIVVIYNPVRTDLLRRQAEEPSGHRWLDNPAMPVILSVGRLEQVKDMAALIQAFALVRRSLDAKLVILGEGSLRNDLRELTHSLSIDADVDMPGFADNPYSFIARADAFALSSIAEGLPNVLLEALALGTPIVATDCPTGPREILRDGKDGILVPEGDLAALAQGIRTCLTSESKRPVAPESLERFEFSKVIDQYAKVLCG